MVETGLYIVGVFSGCRVNVTSESLLGLEKQLDMGGVGIGEESEK